MLTPVSARTSLVVCSTCRFSKESREDIDGRRGGARFAESLRAALEGHEVQDRVALQTLPCLFACTNYCTLFLRDEHRFGYILGRFEPTRESAGAVLDFVAQYLSTREGTVPYSLWPAGVKGHFLVRVPPSGYVWQESMAPSTTPRDADD